MNTLSSVGRGDSPMERAFERIRQAFLNPPDRTISHKETIELRDLMGLDPDAMSRRIEDFAYRALGRLFAKVGRHGYGMGMPQLHMSMEPDHMLHIEWKIPSLANDTALHARIAQNMKVILMEIDYLRKREGQDNEYVVRMANIEQRLQAIVQDGIQLGDIIELKEKAADAGNADGLVEGSQEGA